MSAQEEEMHKSEKKLLLLMEKEKRLEKEINRIRTPGVFNRGRYSDGDQVRSQLAEVCHFPRRKS